MKCPFCNSNDTKVTNSRLVADGMQVRRRRECLVCNERFTTYESFEINIPHILKQDGSVQPFNETKLRQGICRALEKRPARVEQIEAIIERIKAQLKIAGERELTSKFVGELVMTELKALDEVAYIRFASVYRKFQDASEFLKELNLLTNN